MIWWIVCGWWAGSALAFSGLGLLGWVWERKRRGRGRRSFDRRIAYLIPAYREGEVVVHAARSALATGYTRDRQKVVVIADHCSKLVEDAVRAEGAQVVSVDFEQSTKVKALRAGLEQVGPEWDTVVILDADNLVEDDFPSRIAAARNAGLRVVQGRRVAKNYNTSLAALDGLMEHVHNVVFRSGQRALGLPAHLIGSGMAFERRLLGWCLERAQVVGGFDKALQAELCSRGVDVGYVPDAVVYDEKVDNAAALQSQRRRWLATQVASLPRYVRTTFEGLARCEATGLALLLLALVPPRSLLLLGLCGLSLVAWLAGQTGVALVSGIALLALLSTVLLLGLHLGFGRVSQAMRAAPDALVAMVGAALRLRGANDRFIHTAHAHVVALDELEHREKVQ